MLYDLGGQGRDRSEDKRSLGGSVVMRESAGLPKLRTSQGVLRFQEIMTPRGRMASGD